MRGWVRRGLKTAGRAIALAERLLQDDAPYVHEPQPEKKRPSDPNAPDRGDQLAKLNRRMAVMEERLRAEISRELHDVLGQSLTVIKLSLERAMRQSEPEVMLSCLEQSISMTDQAISSVRDLARSLRPALLDELGLAAALRALLLEHELHGNWEVALELDADDALKRFTPVVEITAYRLVQEALTNALRHARARRVSVAVRHTGRLSLSVNDDGVGFDVIRQELGDREHMGLIGMRERAHAAGGTVEIRSAIGKGTSVLIQLPGEVRS